MSDVRCPMLCSVKHCFTGVRCPLSVSVGLDVADGEGIVAEEPVDVLRCPRAESRESLCPVACEATPSGWAVVREPLSESLQPAFLFLRPVRPMYYSPGQRPGYLANHIIKPCKGEVI